MVIISPAGFSLLPARGGNGNPIGNLGILTWVKVSFCLLLLCWARYLIRELFSGDPLKPMVDLLLNFSEAGEVPEKGNKRRG